MELVGCTKEVNEEKGCRGSPAHFRGSMEKECAHGMKEEEKISASLKIMGRPGFDPWVGKIPWRRK